MAFYGLNEGEAWLHVCKSAVPLVRKPDARKSHIRFDERDLETEETVRYSDTDQPKGSETVTAEPNSTAPDLDSTRPPQHPTPLRVQGLLIPSMRLQFHVIGRLLGLGKIIFI